MAFERTLVAIRERPLSEVLDLALVVARRRPGTLGLAALAGIAPFAALNAWLYAGSPDLAGSVATFLWVVEAPLATAPMTVVLGDLMFGRKPSAGRTLAAVGRASVRLVIVHGLLRLIPLLFWLPPRLTFANEILLLERGKVLKLWKRGGDLSTGRAGGLVGLGVFQFVATLVFATAACLGIHQAEGLFRADSSGFEVTERLDMSGPRFQGPVWLAVAFFAVGRFLAYIDQRIRLEGWEVELRLRAVGRAIAEEGRW